MNIGEMAFSYLLFSIFMLIVFAFFLWMLIDCLNRQFPDKTMWIVIIVFATLAGALIYFFTKRKELIEQDKSLSQGQDKTKMISDKSFASTVPQNQNRDLTSQIYPTSSAGLLSQEKTTDESMSSIKHEKPKKSNWSLILIIIIVILLCFSVAGYFAFTFYKNVINLINKPSIVSVTSPSGTNGTQPEASNEQNKIIIKFPDQTKDLLSLTLPQGWISESYYPNGTGSSPISLFASQDDKVKADEILRTHPNDAYALNNSKYSGLRYVLAIKYEENNENPILQIEKYRKLYQNDSLHDQVIADGKTFNEGIYYCVRYKYTTGYEVPCYVVFNKGITFLFKLYTPLDNYTQDLEIYFKIIESTNML